MKLYVLDADMVTLPDTNHLTPERNIGVPITIPAPVVFLIEHPKGMVLFDTGMQMEEKPELRVDRQIAKLGYNPEDIKYVVLSHMHMDHAGGMTLFPNATFVVRKREMQAAWWPEDFEHGYVYADYKDTRAYNYIQLRDDEAFDLFFDGTLVCIDTRGHTPGHQSLVVDLPNSGKIVLAGDAVQLAVQLDEKGILPGISWNSADAMCSIEKLRHMKAEGMFVIPGHDLGVWETLKIAPAFYD